MHVAFRSPYVMLAAAGFFSLLPARSDAQSAVSSGQIVGQVSDVSGAAVVGAEVTVRNRDTNYMRRTTSDSAGRFALTLLPAGPYEANVKASGLQATPQELVVTVGGSVTTQFMLRIRPLRTDIEVTWSDPARTESKAVLTDQQVRNLPLSGRRVRTMFTLTPSTQIEPECGGFAISGQKGLFTNITVDGGDYTNTHWCGHVEFSPSFSLEAVQEFQVLRSTFSAEFGRSTGGVINILTKSGTNQHHGTGYYLFRNNALTKDDPFGRQPIGLGQQFGGSIGGPLARDRTFFHAAGEFQYNTKPVQVLYSALDTQNLRGTPGAAALLSTAPEDKFTALSQSQSVVARLDHRLNDRNNLMARFDYIRNRVTDNVGGVILTQGLGADSVTNRALSNQVLLTNRNDVTGMVQLTSVLSDKFLNELRVEVVHEYRPWEPGGTGPEVTVRNAGATVAIYGPQATGLAYGNIGYRFSDTRYQVVNSFSIVTGAHIAKFGIDSNRVTGRTTFDPGSNGIYTFNSLGDFLVRRPFQYQQFAGSGSLETTIHQLALYAQDEWRLRPGLTISPGLRYDMAFLPDYYKATVPQNRFPGATSIPDDAEMFGPRLGVSWRPGNSATTVVRAAGGLFYAAPYMPVFEQSMLTNGGNPELSSLIVLTASPASNDINDAFRSVGIDLAQAPVNALPVFTRDQLNQLFAPESRIAGQTVNFIDPNFKLPRAAHFRTAFEHTLSRGIIAGLDFTYINTTRIARVRNLNLPVPLPDATGRPIYSGARPFAPKYGFVQVTESSARSLYRGITASLNVKRPRLVFNLYYTLGWSYSYDDTERGISGVVFDDAYNLRNEYTYSNIDQRHQVAADGVFYMPRGFDLSGTLRFNTGRPFSALAGTDLNRDGVLRDRPVIDGRVLPRNSLRNTRFCDVSLRLQRGFGMLRGRGRMITSLDVFNLFDFDNVEVGSANMVYGPGTVFQGGRLMAQAPPANFGQVRNAQGNYLTNSTLRTAPRQFQLGLRFEF